MAIKLILTGSTGMVGEGVLLTCLDNPEVEKVLMVNRKHNPLQNPKLTELLVPNFMQLEQFKEQLSGYDACFYCAGVSSVGMNEADYTKITYDTPVHFANTLVALNPTMTFSHISGGHTDGTEQGKVMWARVKGKAENALMRLPFKAVYNFRPGLMKPIKGQKNIKTFYKIMLVFFPIMQLFFPPITLTQLGLAMINSVRKGYPINVLEVKDIKALADA